MGETKQLIFFRKRVDKVIYFFYYDGMDKYQYRIVWGSVMRDAVDNVDYLFAYGIDEEVMLDEYGAEGWELVATESVKVKEDGPGTKRQVYWLKRIRGEIKE